MASRESAWSYKKLQATQDVALNDIFSTHSSSLSAEETDNQSQPVPKSFYNQKPKTSIAIFTMITALLMVFIAFGVVRAGLFDFGKRQAPTATASSTEVPEYFQTTPEVFAGPTATGRAPFLAETNPAPFGPSRSFVPNTPLETAIPINGNAGNASIFQLMGQLSPYFPNPTGFGVDEYPLPAGANISQVHVFHRHGSRYPTTDAGVQKLGTELEKVVANGTAKFSGALSFLNSFSYELGAEILVPVGRQELFDSGVLHYYNYGHLYNTSTKIIARTTSQDRMLKSSEYFMAGFFGLDWSKNVTLERIIEGQGFNISLAGYDNCNNSNLAVNLGGDNATKIWENKYLKDATARFNALSKGYNWTVSDVYNAQTLCPYETVAFGYSAFCDLFTYQEWQDFEYSIDIDFAGNNYFESPTGRAVGIGYVQEVLARLENHTIDTPTAQNNITLDNNTVTFPLNQTLYFDFTHDTNIAGALTAFGLTQFAPVLPTSGPPPNHSLVVSHIQPFAGRLDIEIINAPQPVAVDRTEKNDTAYTPGPPTKYIHFIINQRTLPLGRSFPACEQRTDGWCELGTFVKIQQDSLKNASYEFSCNGKYDPVPYGSITNGVPLATPPPS